MAETLNQRWSAQLVAALAHCGVRNVVVAPGSRSSPLALAFAELPTLSCWPVIDERSAGFFALGLSKGSGAPTALLCTSGSAGAHLLPAVMEASHGGVALIVLTADRPWELHGFGAPQTTDQSTLFGHFARTELLPAPEEGLLPHLVAVVAQAVHRGGVVHLNAPFREPLAPPLPAERGEGRGEGPVVRPPSFSQAAALPDLSHLRAALASSERPLIVCGPREREDEFAPSVHALAEQLGAPVLAEAASNARYGFPSISAYDAILRSPKSAIALRPDLVLRFGGGLTLKTLQSWLDEGPAPQFHVTDDGALFDPAHRAEAFLVGAAPQLCRALGSATTRAHGYRAQFEQAQSAAVSALAVPELSEPAAAQLLVAALPPGATLVLSSSMPIRDVDAFAVQARAPLRVFSNRGLNGIDGVTSTALGIAAATSRPAALLIGDLALLHDLSGWVLAKQHHLSLTVVVVNNDGGGIFHFLPIAERTEHFERLFGTPHGVELSHLAALADATFHRPLTVSQLQDDLTNSLEGGLHLIEVRTNRTENVALHRAISARAAQAVEASWR